MDPSILIVDDEPFIIKSLSGLLSDEGFEVISAANGYEALKMIEKESPDLVLLDIWMPGIDGIETLKEIRKADPVIQVIMITGHGTIDTAVNAIKLGAFSFIEKPLSFDKIVVSINNALNFKRLEEENKYLRKKILERNSITGISPATKYLRKQIESAAPSDSWIMITGENGTGKELVARNIHQLSLCAQEPLIDLNCATIPESIIESELFGHEKGVLGENSPKKRGKFEMAGKGTLFLDEVGDMSLKIQAKILRVLQQLKFERVGGTRILDFKARVIAASNMDLEKNIQEQKFREDLYYRLNVIPIKIEPLRNRKEDIPFLIDAFFEEFSDLGKKKQITDEAVALLQNHLWPGNVRELKNLIERLVIMVSKDVIEAQDIPAPYTGRNLIEEEQLFLIEKFKDAKIAFEKKFIKRKFFQHNQDMDKTAEAVGLSKNSLKKKLEN